ncbi:cupredoxin family copper-binding protein [Phenylobacterium sp.]|uniref:cupredoxin domain-containing protein n=1 Tax=Phenylobacterium sp. TaxID=1871053 RepID=UPI002DEB7D6D|nr:cupredoxin family copper-binding protein [Phenylobacterium sp.]
MSYTYLRGALAAAAFTLALNAATSAPAAEAARVTIGNFTFGPAALTVKPGTTVTWLNGDDIPHTVVADDKKTFRSKVLDSGDTFSFTFTAPGTYPYFCSIHPHMTGKVIVKAS